MFCFFLMGIWVFMCTYVKTCCFVMLSYTENPIGRFLHFNPGVEQVCLAIVHCNIQTDLLVKQN